MDPKTIKVYDEKSKEFENRHSEQIPVQLYELSVAFLSKGQPTAGHWFKQL